MYREKIINIENGTEIYREYTLQEIAEVERAQAEAANQTTKEAETAILKTALLEKLGITEQEAKLLLS